MSEDQLPVPQDGGPSWLDKINLPHLIAGPAGKALSRLVAGVADIPAAYLERVAKGIRDGTANRHTVNSSVGKVAAKAAAKDPEIVQRAVSSLLAKEFRKQENKEAIAKKAAEILESESEISQSEDISEDWMNVFERHAEAASTVKMQDLWARVLAGQIRKPKSFSLQTLRFVSELDEHIASIFEKHVTHVIEGQLIPYPPREGELFGELLSLEEFGLITGASGQLSHTYDVPAKTFGFRYRSHAFAVNPAPSTENLKFTFPCVILTRVGREIYAISQAADDPEVAQKFADAFPKEDIERIFYYALKSAEGGASSIRDLWIKPAAPPLT